MKKKSKETPYGAYLKSLSETDAQLVADFFAALCERILLPKAEREALLNDFENALLYYASVGLAPEEALRRLDAKKLGGFYVRPPRLWYALDNAAKIYPLAMKHGYMAVFRLSVTLQEAVVPELLQIALTFTIKRFPSFATTVKKGVFWHYLDATKRRYRVSPEASVPCRPLKISGSGSQSFRVLFYRNRISVEYFHVLTDGTGGMVFLKTLTAEYMRLLGVASPPFPGILNVQDDATPGETANEFRRAEKTENASGFAERPAAQFGGKLSKAKPCRVLHLKMNAARLKEVARQKNATVTAYLLALMFVAGKRATDGTEGEMSIQVPVNMRKFYPSETVRNFAMYGGIRLPVASITDADSILDEIKRQLAQKTSKAAMSEMMNATNRMVSLVRYVPLFVKAPVARLLYGFLGDRVISNTLSNLGVAAWPPELAEHIESMDFVLGTALTNRAGCSMVTCGDIATFTISKNTNDPSFEETMVELLTADGVAPIVEGSELYEN